MDHGHHDDKTSGSERRTWVVFALFAAIAGFYLLTEHRAHLFGALPYILLALCPLLHLFGHGGHGSGSGKGGPHDH